MGIMITCDFCGKTNAYGRHIIIYNTENHTQESNHYMCDDCFQKHITSHIHTSNKNYQPIPTEQEPTKEPIEVTKTEMQSPFIGMSLRDFLRTDYYLSDTDTIYTFQAADGDTIIDLHKWIRATITSFSQKNDNSEIIITLNTTNN